MCDKLTEQCNVKLSADDLSHLQEMVNAAGGDKISPGQIMRVAMREFYQNYKTKTAMGMLVLHLDRE